MRSSACVRRYDAILTVLASLLVPASVVAQTDANGFFTDYLTAIGYNAGGSTPSAAESETDSLCDGDVSEDTIAPEEGLELLPPVVDAADCAGSRAPSFRGFHPSALLDAGGNLPIAIHTVNTSTLDFQAIVLANDAAASTDNIMAYSWVYVENVTDEPLDLYMGIGSDDSIEVRVNRQRVFVHLGGRGSGGNNTVQDKFPVTLNPGGNLVQFKTWQGGGGWNMRARLEDLGDCPGNSRSGTPVLSGGGLIEVGTTFVDFEPRANRSVESSGSAPEPVTASIIVAVEAGGAAYDLEETFDAAWTASNVTPPAAESGAGFLRWTGITAVEVSYTLTRSGDWGGDQGVISGSSTIGGVAGPVGGDSQIAGGWFMFEYPQEILITAAMMNSSGCNVPGDIIDGAWIEGVDGDGNDVTDATIVPVEGMEIFPQWGGASQSQGLSQISLDAQDRFWTEPGDSSGGMVLNRVSTGGGFVDWQSDAVYGAVDNTMNVAYFYAVNPTDTPVVVYGSVGTDDSAGVRVNGLPVFSDSTCRGDPGFADKFRIRLDPGKNLISYSAFEGGGGWNARFRFEDETGQPMVVPTTVNPAGYDPDMHEAPDVPRTHILHASEILLTAAFRLDTALYTGNNIPAGNISGPWIAGVDGDGNAVTDTAIVPFEGMRIFPDFGGASQALGLTDIGAKDIYWTDPLDPSESGTNVVRSTDPDARYDLQGGGIFTNSPDPNTTTAVGWFYVVNRGPDPICATIAFRSDDSGGVRVNGRTVHTITIGRGLGNYDTADRFPARFDPGKNLVAVQAFDNTGGFGVAARVEYESTDGPLLELTLDPADYDPDPAAHPEPGPDCETAGASLTYARSGPETGIVTEYLVTELPFEQNGGGGTISGAVPEDYVSQEGLPPDPDTIFEGALVEPGTSGVITTAVRATDCGFTRLVKFNGYVDGDGTADPGDLDGNAFFASVGNTNYSASIFFHAINRTNSDLDAWFAFASDDGASLFVNGELVVEYTPGRGRGGNNILQTYATQAATLLPGDNLVQLSYKQGSGGSGVRVGMFPDECFADAFGPEIEVSVNPPGVAGGAGDRLSVTRSLSEIDGCSDNATVTLRFSVPGGTADVDLTEVLPAGASGSNASSGTFNPGGTELSFQGPATDGMTITYDVSGASASAPYGCSTVNGAPVLGEGSFQDPCPSRCFDLHESGGIPEMLVIGPIDPGGNTSDNGLCDDNGNLGTTDYLTNADGSVSEENIEVLLGDEIEPDFGGAAGGVGVKAAVNTRINPRAAEGILTVWRAAANPGGDIDFNLSVNIGDPVDDYIVYGLTYLENTTDEPLEVMLEVGSDDAVKVIVNGEQLWVNAVCRGIPGVGAGDMVPATLEPGKNSVLIAVVERGGGTGVRLIVRDEFGEPLTGGDVLACRSPESPEPPGASLLPGDVNGDGTYNISDPVAQLNFMFAGQNLLPECFTMMEAGGITLTDTGLLILDFNDDRSSNIADAVGSLNFLFAGEGNPGPALGTDCVELPGTCVSNCQ